jgi:hypothetical protein
MKLSRETPPPGTLRTPTLTGPASETLREGTSRAGIHVRLTAEWNPYHGAELYYSLAYRSERRYTPTPTTWPRRMSADTCSRTTRPW